MQLLGIFIISNIWNIHICWFSRQISQNSIVFKIRWGVHKRVWLLITSTRTGWKGWSDLCHIGWAASAVSAKQFLLCSSSQLFRRHCRTKDMGCQWKCPFPYWGRNPGPVWEIAMTGTQRGPPHLGILTEKENRWLPGPYEGSVQGEPNGSCCLLVEDIVGYLRVVV